MTGPRYAHVGFPKCGSTALQKGYFAEHPELFHLGASGGGATAPYRSAGLRTLIELDLRLARDYAYDPERMRRTIERETAPFSSSERTIMGLSSESLTLHMHNEPDVTRKAERLCDALGADTRIVILTRRQDTLLQSLYREFIKSGLTLTFNEFVRTLYINQVTSLYSELFYDRAFETYSRLFGAENVLVLPHEWLLEDPPAFLAALSEHLGVSNVITELGVRNRGPGDAVLEARRRLNAHYPFGLALSVLDGVNMGRYPEYFEDRLGIAIPDEVRREDERRTLTKRLARDWIKGHGSRIERLRRHMRLGPAPTGLDMTVDPDVWERLRTNYARANRRLATTTGMDLERFGYLDLAASEAA